MTPRAAPCAFTVRATCDRALGRAHQSPSRGRLKLQTMFCAVSCMQRVIIQCACEVIYKHAIKMSRGTIGRDARCILKFLFESFLQLSEPVAGMKLKTNL